MPRFRVTEEWRYRVVWEGEADDEEAAARGEWRGTSAEVSATPLDFLTTLEAEALDAPLTASRDDGNP